MSETRGIRYEQLELASPGKHNLWQQDEAKQEPSPPASRCLIKKDPLETPKQIEGIVKGSQSPYKQQARSKNSQLFPAQCWICCIFEVGTSLPSEYGTELRDE